MTFVQRQPNHFDVGPTLYKCYSNVLSLPGTGGTTQQRQNIWKTFVQRQPDVFDAGLTLYKCYSNVLCLPGMGGTTQQRQNLCITFVEHQPDVFDVGLTLYKCYSNVLCLLGSSRCLLGVEDDITTKNHWSEGDQTTGTSKYTPCDQTAEKSKDTLSEDPALQGERHRHCQTVEGEATAWRRAEEKLSTPARTTSIWATLHNQTKCWSYWIYLFCWRPWRQSSAMQMSTKLSVSRGWRMVFKPVI